MWDCFITIGCLVLGAYFVVIEPLWRKWRERGEKTEAPRFPPPTVSQKNTSDRFNDLLAEIVAMGSTPGAVPGTEGTGNEPVPGTSTDTQEEKSQYHRVKEMVLQGFSGNQIFKKLGGKRQAVLDLVRQVKKDLGIDGMDK